MKDSVPVVDKLKSWPSLNKQLAWEAEYVAAQQEEIQRIKNYVHTGKVGGFSYALNAYEWARQPSRSVYLYVPLAILGRVKVSEAYSSPAEELQSRLASAVLYRELSSLLEIFLEEEFPARFGRKRQGLPVNCAGWLGLAAAVGAMEVLDRWAPLLVKAAREGYIQDKNKKGLQHFILRLWCAANAEQYPDTDFPRFEVAEGVLEMWGTHNLDVLRQWLVQLCNQHTRLTGGRESMDFAGEFSHFPVEVLMLFRLREQRGLENPEIDHPLMRLPWSRLWPIRPAEPDALLSSVYARLQEDEGVSRDELYKTFFPVPL